MPAMPPRGFPIAEFETRTARAQNLMAAQGVDGLLLTTEPEVRYFSGFFTPFWQSPTRPWFLFVPSEGKPVAVVPEIGGAVMRGTWIEDVRTWPSPRPDDEGLSVLSDLLGDLAQSATIGLPMGPETHVRMPQADLQELTERIAPRRLTDATAIVRDLRMVKSGAEIEKIRFICGIVSGTFDRLPDFVQSGMSEIEIFRAFRLDALNAGADDVPYLVGGLGDGGLSDIISPPTDRCAAPGDILMLDTGATFDGYFCDFDRNYSFGTPRDAARRAYATVYAALDAGLIAAKPGATCRDLYSAMQKQLEAGGAQGNDVGRLGHGLGMQLTEWPSNAAHDETELIEGMVLTLEPGMTFDDDKVMVLEENIVITGSGWAPLTHRAPPHLPEIG